MAKKKKLLPKDFAQLLLDGSLADLQGVFATCDVNARGGYSKQTALAFNECPDELARWLVEQGADISAPDTYGDTPLHARAGHWQGRLGVLLELGADVNAGEGARGTPLHKAAAFGGSANARHLLSQSARVDALDRLGFTPLEVALRGCRNADIEKIAELAEILLAAGAMRRPRMTAFVTRIGTDFEFHRAGFNPEYLDSTDAALTRLYAMFDIPAVPRRAMHDGKSAIVARAAGWQAAHQELWELLVPSQGAAETIQGEIIRISGRIADEIERNGGVNWDGQFRAMADAWLAHAASGQPLSPAELAEAGRLTADVKRRAGDTERMMELAVAWVALNPAPVALPPPDYQR